MSEDPIKLFISHASEDKQPFVEQLYSALGASPKLDVWYDTDSLHLGDSLTFEISDGLKNCDYALVVLSPIYITKKWCKLEYASMIALETSETKIILPIWHDNITEQQVKDFAPLLADRVAIHSTRPLADIVLTIETATWTGQKARQLANPSLKERAVRIKNTIVERQTIKQLTKSTEGAELVNKDATLILNRFEQLIKELEDTLAIQTQRYDTPTHAFPWRCIVASGPLNANIEVGYADREGDSITRNRLFMHVFNWDYCFPAVQGKRKVEGHEQKVKGHVRLIPFITANREVEWKDQDKEGPYFTNEQVAQEAVEHLLAFIEASSKDAFP
jgi:hypothetical protein